MGGQAFASGPNPLYTPRMSPAVYRFVKSWCHTQLHKLFIRVDTPIEGPGKKDFGDIDVFMAGVRPAPASEVADLVLADATTKDYLTAAQKLLGAQRAIFEKDGCGIFAVPWPTDAHDLEPDAAASGDQAPARFIQVDVHICPSVEELEWHVFKHAHGDLWNLLGSTIRPFGLTVDEVGMWLRIPEIEELNRNRAKVLLTRDPAAILKFLGLSSEHGEWDRQFGSVAEVFEYATTCRLFWVRPEEKKKNASSGSDGDGEGEDGATGGEFERKKLKANDRRRMAQRPMFRQWIDEFLPKLREEKRFGEPRLTRDGIRDEAFETFEGVREEYETRLLEWQRQRQRETLWKEVIKGSVPEDLEPTYRGCLSSALKKIIMEDDESFGIRPEMPMRDENGIYIVDNVRAFVTQKWEEVGKLAWARNHERYLQSKAFKSKGKKQTDSGKDSGGQ